jgi:hypothetical protein
MPLKLAVPTEREFTLDKSDKLFENKGPASIVNVRQATQGDFERRKALYTTFERSFNGETITVNQRFSPEDLFRLEVEISMCGCNILDSDDKPLFKFRGKVVDPVSFAIGWNKLPPEIAEEIHEKVLEVNPLWAGPLDES